MNENQENQEQRGVEVPLAELFERIGLLVVRVDEWKKQYASLQEMWQRTSQVAGAALRALEVVGRKDIADAIQAGKPWSVEDSDVAAQDSPSVDPEDSEGGTPASGDVVKLEQDADSPAAVR
jgi:hypothetical protein